MAETRVCAGCGRKYWWPGARWQHEKCVVQPVVAKSVDKMIATPPFSPVLASSAKTANSPGVHCSNVDIPKVKQASKHNVYRDKDKRKAYMRAYMARKRAASSA